MEAPQRLDPVNTGVQILRHRRKNIVQELTLRRLARQCEVSYNHDATEGWFESPHKSSKNLEGLLRAYAATEGILL